MMEPLTISVRVSTAMASHVGTIGLDSLLMALVCERENRPSVATLRAEGIEPQPVPIPVQLSACGRVYLATFARMHATAKQARFARKKPCTQELLALTGENRANLQTGPDKAWQVPYDDEQVTDELRWWCIGDRVAIADLLSGCTHLGGRRGTGHGSTMTPRGALWWKVESCESWPGFPVLDRDRHPLRPLPLDWPGMAPTRFKILPLKPPYWEAFRGEQCATG